MLVYVREAHGGDAWALQVNKRQGFEVPLARNYAEKNSHADLCVRKLDIEFSTVVDRMDFPVEADYTAWPERLYLVDEAGKIVYKGGPGPFGFEPNELEEAIKNELSGERSQAAQTHQPSSVAYRKWLFPHNQQ